MAKEILPFQKKLSLTFFSLVFVILLVYFSQNFGLNEKSQRLLVKTLNVR